MQHAKVCSNSTQADEKKKKKRKQNKYKHLLMHAPVMHI